MAGKDALIDGMVDKPKRSMVDFEVGSIRRAKTKKPVKKVQKVVNYGDPLALKTKSRANTVSKAKKQEIIKKHEQATEDFLKPVKALDLDEVKAPKTAKVQKTVAKTTPSKPVKQISKEDLYKREVLGFSDDEIEMDSDDISDAKRMIKEAKKAEKNRNKEQKKNKIWFLRHKIITFVLIPLLIVLIIGYVWGDSLIKKITNGQSSLFDFLRSAVVSKDIKFATAKSGRTNILVFGTSGYDMSGSEGDGVHDGALLTDSIMIISLNQETGEATVTSIPRDLKTSTCINDKINELYYCSNTSETDGANALKDRVSEITGMEIQYWAHLDWVALIQIVNAVDDITVTLDEDINDDWTDTHIKAGVPTTLNGEKALGLARARYGTENGDFSRGASQQKIFEALVNKLKEKNLSMFDLINLANIFGDNLRSNFNSDDIIAGANVLSNHNLKVTQLPLINTPYGDLLTSGNINGVSYVYPTAGIDNYSVIQEYLNNKNIVNSDTMDNANILVLNGSGVDGLAATEKNELNNSGFKNVVIGSAPSGEYFEKIYIYKITDNNMIAQKIKTYYNTELLPKNQLPDNIDTSGIDFVIILGVGYNN